MAGMTMQGELLRFPLGQWQVFGHSGAVVHQGNTDSVFKFFQALLFRRGFSIPLDANVRWSEDRQLLVRVRGGLFLPMFRLLDPGEIELPPDMVPRAAAFRGEDEIDDFVAELGNRMGWE